MVYFKDFPEFKPTLTPQQMFKAGIYMVDVTLEKLHHLKPVKHTQLTIIKNLNFYIIFF